ncbi:MRG-domain-containing protein [Mariannaea sp. PMI_226]|nr:MRG-domain-containing protein [Mariannaea sp. PMI_226]
MAPARQQPAPPPFSKDEKVLCFHMDMLYEAKIMDVQPGEKPSDGYRYKVHYKGWKNTWDDWVMVDRIRPFDDEHKELAAQLHAQAKHSMQRNPKQTKKVGRGGPESARVSEERAGSATVQGSRGGRRGKDWELEQVRPLLSFSARALVASANGPVSVTSVRANSCESDPVRLDELEEVSDHLLDRPVPGYRYLKPTGKIAFDDRYCYNQKKGKTRGLQTRLRPRQACQTAPKSMPKPKPEPRIKHKPGSIFGQSDDSYKIEDTFHNKVMIQVHVPDHVQALLVDDWENITKNNQLVPLPHTKPVSKILEDYLAQEKPQREEGSASMDILEEVVAGLREYFEKALSRILLYRFERHQYMDVRKLWENADDDAEIKGVCDVYGAEHLARLIVSLPELLAQTNMDQQSVGRLKEEIGKFTSWLSKNCETYFVSEYETPSQDYVDKARSV